ncbi:copper resistance protein CopB [Sphingobium sp. Ant17]|nr:copper resistance protein CopB [Sphingobium sp. Ant17]
MFAFMASSSLALCSAAGAQTMDHSQHSMPGMAMPAELKPKPKAVPKPAPAKKKPAPATARQPATHEGHGMPVASPRADALPRAEEVPEPLMDHHAMGHDMSGRPVGEAMPGDHDMSSMDSHGTGGTSLPAGIAPAPAPAQDWAADSVHDPREMAEARAREFGEHGGGRFSQVIMNVFEYQARKGQNGYRWDGEAWYGGDIHRLTIKTEGEGSFKGGVDTAEVQALYSRAIDPYWNLQTGVRYDIQPRPSHPYATIGLEGLAPGWFEVETALFLSNEGDLHGRLDAYYDQRITQKMVLQPRVEVNVSAQDVPHHRIGSGVSNVELGLRLRYEIAREFAPYVGVSYERRVGDTARFARLDGEDPSSTSFVAGIRFWF